MLAPIILFTYNRPSHTKLTVEALKKNRLAKDSELHIYSDGILNGSDRESVAEVRKFIAEIEGFKSVHILEREGNLGLSGNIIDGVSSILSNHDRVIVLEDDLITSPWFLTFMNEALESFKNETKIGHIHGFCFPIENLPETFLINWCGSWGWATWRRAWHRFNPNGEELLTELKKRKLTHRFNFNGKYPYTRMLQQQVKGKNNSWAIRWNASLFLNDVLSLNAGRSLVQNIGFDGTGMHCGDQEIYVTELHTNRLKINNSDPIENLKVRHKIGLYYREKNSFTAKAKRRLKKIWQLTLFKMLKVKP